jgi:phosphomethylpyrimidine synthase
MAAASDRRPLTPLPRADGSLEPMCIGKVAKVKINANIENSAVSSDINGEIEKLAMAI